MASPPFTLNVTIPGDTDIVSQFPGVDRTHLDILNSWLKTDHNVNGTHNYSTYLQVGVADSGGNTAAAPSPATSNTAIFRDTDGALKAKNGDDSSVAFLGTPPGVVAYLAGPNLPTGWLWADGSAVSRTIYARLFAQTSTTFGSGDGSTTFNLPDISAVSIVGKDRSGTGKITTAGSGVDATTLGAKGGFQNIVLDATMIPSHNHTVFLNDPGHYHFEATGSGGGGQLIFGTNTGVTSTAGGPANTSQTTDTRTTNITIGPTTGAGAVGNVTGSLGGGLLHNNVHPVIVLNAIIKY